MSAGSTRPKVAMLGATGLLGKPVAEALIREGFDLSVMSRRPERATGLEGATLVSGDVFDGESLRRAFAGRDIVYLNLRAAARPSDPQPETDGLRNVIDAAKATEVRRIAMISSMVKDYEGTNGFHSWTFQLKHESARILRDSGLEWTIFSPSSFMENFLDSYREGDAIALVGRAKHPQWFIAGEDYGRQVARSFELESAAATEYFVQGPEPLLTDDAAEIFVRNRVSEKLRITHQSIWPLRIGRFFNRNLADIWSIVEALNEYPETFRAERTWNELGPPRITLAEFARTAP